MKNRTDTVFDEILSRQLSGDTRAMVEALHYVAVQLDDVNAGLAGMLNNDPQLVTSGVVEDLKSYVSSLIQRP
jgi:regulatory protein YycI of two-component signal transduction system YycFG